MKKLLAIALSVLLLATCLAGATLAMADGTDEGAPVEPVYLIDGEDLTVYHGFNNCEGAYNYEMGCVTLTATGDDPYYHLMVSETPVQVGPWLAIKYRTTCSMQGQIFASQHKPAREDCSFRVTYGTNGAWCVAAYYLPTRLSEVSINPETGEPEVGYDPETNLLSWLRYDFGEAAGDWIDIEYIAFFNTDEEVYAYEHSLPTPPMQDTNLPYDQEDGSEKTFIFDSVDNIKTFLLEESHWNQVTAREGEPGYVTFVATDADPYIFFNDDAVKTSAKNASYLVVKYRTTASSREVTRMETYTAVRGGPSWCGDTHAKADLISDGEWHYVLIDASNTIGRYEGALYSFRLDVLAAADAGESIDIAVLKLFDEMADVKGFFELRAHGGDTKAQEFLDTHTLVIPEPKPEETTTAEPETEPVESQPVTTETDDGCDGCETWFDGEPTTDTDTDTEAAVDTTAADDITTAVDTTAKVEDTTAAPAAEGCKAVMASASILGVIALAAGIAVRKKD